MTGALRRKWVAALESGRFEQARGSLKEDGAYCCLGVLGRVCGVKSNSTAFAEYSGCGDISGLRQYTYWNPALRTDVKPYENKLPALAPAVESMLVTANDEEMLNFKQIAQIIRNTPLRAFNGDK
jgi:hypothetical protein